MGSFSIWHWLVVLLIVVLVFGTKKLRNLGSEVKGFKEGIKSADEEEIASPKQTESRIIDVDAKDTTQTKS